MQCIHDYNLFEILAGLSHSLRLACAICFAALALGILACEPWPQVKFVNGTNHDVLIFEGDRLAYTLARGETVEQDTTKDDWISAIRVTTRDGTVLLDKMITYNDLGNRDFKIVVSCDLNATPNASVC